MKPEDIPAWCFLTGQFLLRFERNKGANHYTDVHQDFLRTSETNPPLNDFFYVNPGVVIMLCYGLLVYPVEYWNNFLKDQVNMKRLGKEFLLAAKNIDVSIENVSDLFKIHKWEGVNSDEYFLRKLRNAIAHSHIKFDSQNDTYRFWNVNRSDKIDFDVSTTTRNIGIFLSGLGRHFSNIQRRIR